MCNFTNGEWLIGSHKIKDSDNWNVESDFDCGWNYVGTSNGVIAMVVTKSYTDTEMDANAHLIAAAPEMYKMLEKVLTEYKEMLGMSQEVKDIEQLLVKCRGGKQ